MVLHPLHVPDQSPQKSVLEEKDRISKEVERLSNLCFGRRQICHDWHVRKNCALCCVPVMVYQGTQNL